MRAWIPLLATLALTACDAGPKAVVKTEQAATPAAAPAAFVAAPSSTTERRTDPRDVPAPLVAGKPMWSANRDHTAEENARFHFEKDGADFGAKTVDDFVAKAHAFTAKPPKGAEVIKRRNGDRLIYDAKSNVFAVVTKTGAPRTMFKPRDGAGYWQKQLSKEQTAGGREN